MRNKKDLKKDIILLIIVCIICFLILEITIRVVGEYDLDGGFHFKGQRTKPYTLPYNELVMQVTDFEKIERPYLIPDRYLGWTIANNSVASDGRYSSNSIGIRSDKEFTINKPKGVIRIALFGDSFVHGDDVPLEQTIAFHLEKKLSKEFNIEIMNFGVGGYGIDQAYLRWKLFGMDYSPDIVIIGFQPENCKRNLNIIRKFYYRGTGIPFSKPRFYLCNDSLNLINYPTLSYSDVPETVKNFENSELQEFEYFYNPTDYQATNVLYYSKAFAVFFSFIDYLNKAHSKELFYQIDSNESKLNYEIISTFYKEASNNSSVYLLHLPVKSYLDRKLNKNDYVYNQLLTKLANNFNLINPDTKLISEAEKTSIQSLYYQGHGHYSNKSNYVVANEIYNQLYPELILLEEVLIPLGGEE